MKNQIDENTKKKLLEEHFFYEVKKMIETFSSLKSDESGENHAVVDLFVHIRILYYFFYGNFYSEKRIDEAHAGDYLKSWRDKQASDKLKDWIKKVNMTISHLDYSRVTEKYNPPRKLLYIHFRDLVIFFLKEFDPQYLGPNLTKLLKNLKATKI